jgi:transcriptional regulator with XRE-family HTH domain
MVTDFFVERLQAHLDGLNNGAQRGQRVTAYKVALEVGLDPTYVTNIFRGRKNGTPETIKRLSSSKLLNLTYERLRSWQALKGLEPEVIHTCIQEMGHKPYASAVEQEDASGLKLIPYRWQLSDRGFTEIAPSADGFKWPIKHLPPDIVPQLGSVQVVNNLLWPPVPSGSVLLVRPVLPPHLMHADRWYAVQFKYGNPLCCMVKYDPVLCRINTLDASGLPIEVTVNTLQYTFEIIQYQVNLAGV